VKSLASTIVIQIEDELDTLYKLPWELLEHPSLWPEGTMYDTRNAKRLGIEVFIKRKATAIKKAISERAARRNNGVYRFEASLSVSSARELYPMYNILVVSNRDTTDEDDHASHFQIARPLCAALCGVDENIHFQCRDLPSWLLGRFAEIHSL
jgi:hypothetical protein